MAISRPKRKCTLAVLEIEIITSIIGDWTASSLSSERAAAAVLARVSGATALALLAAAIDLARQQASNHAAIVAGLEDEIALREADIEDLEYELAGLHANWPPAGWVRRCGRSGRGFPASLAAWRAAAGLRRPRASHFRCR
jgi:hypothetical protein